MNGPQDSRKPKTPREANDNLRSNRQTNADSNEPYDSFAQYTASDPTGSSSYNLGGYGSGMYGGGMYGGGMYNNSLGYGGTGMMSPYYGMMSPGPLSGLNQFLFSVQSVIFSLSQAVNIVGMNAQSLKQLAKSLLEMWDHALETWHQMQALEQRARYQETAEDRKRRARLRALRMALVAGISYLGYRLVRRLMFPTRHRALAASRYHHQYPGMPTTSSGNAGYHYY